MLKIKNNVDLKELEKYGYKEYDTGRYEKEIALDNLNTLFILVSRKKIMFRIEFRFFCGISNTSYTQKEFGFFITRYHLKDLIKNKLVEKVEG